MKRQTNLILTSIHFQHSWSWTGRGVGAYTSWLHLELVARQSKGAYGDKPFPPTFTLLLSVNRSHRGLPRTTAHTVSKPAGVTTESQLGLATQTFLISFPMNGRLLQSGRHGLNPQQSGSEGERDLCEKQAREERRGGDRSDESTRRSSEWRREWPLCDFLAHVAQVYPIYLQLERED